uniref:CFA20 domain-containing protein n=1 Tax=Myripristis murdjan TaxID=586833 RepID=A0A667YUY0_9TELE
MFKHNYQGGAVVEIFSAQGKDPVAKWKLNGGIAIPFVLRFLFFFPDSFINRVTDIGHLKRRLYLSTVHKDLSITPLFVFFSFFFFCHSGSVFPWSNLCIDLVSFTGELFKGAGFLTLDGITLSASCKLRKIFTMKTEPAGVSDNAGLMDLIPRSCHFQPDVNHITLVLNMDMVRKADVRTGLSATSRTASLQKNRPQGFSHTAFGTRVSGPPPQTGRKNNPSGGMDGSATHALNMVISSYMNHNMRTVIPVNHVGTLVLYRERRCGWLLHTAKCDQHLTSLLRQAIPNPRIPKNKGPIAFSHKFRLWRAKSRLP